MTFPRIHRENGIALIIVMISVLILTILAGGFAYAMKVEMKLAMNSRNFSELEWLGRSGMEYAKWILAEDMKLDPRDATFDIWAGGSGGLNVSNSVLAEIHLPLTVHLGRGEFTLHPMLDTERKININRADELLLQRVLTSMGADAGEIPTVIGSILDWIDPDDTEHLQGAESDFYEGFDPPYEAKNGPLDDITELLLIQGVNERMFRGGGGGPFVFERAVQGGGGRFFEEEMPTYAFGLVDVFTAVSSGRINGMTVDARTLALLPGMDEFLAGQYLEMRGGIDGVDGTEDDQLPDLSFIIPDAAARAQAQALLDTRSTTFEVRVTATMGGVSREFVGLIVRNNPNDVQLVSFYAPDDK
ncbi:MAG: general secretion pathway protein GspK [Verrucomicrobia bacterium]|jgi:general secretion pathway protein K|nr:general secretion pathway protein GspK [Verrucomicrobiota bacterium]